MPKIIAAVDHLDMKPGPTSNDRPTAMGLESCVGVEHIDFEPELKIEGRVEYYLQDIQDRLIDSLRKIMARQLKAFQVKTSMAGWLKDTPNQIILTVSLLDFTIEMGQVFEKIGAQPDMMQQFYQKKVDGLVALIELVRTDLSKSQT